MHKNVIWGGWLFISSTLLPGVARAQSAQEITLEETIELVMRNHLSVDQAIYSRQQAEQSIQEAQGAFDPQLSVEMPGDFGGYRQRATWDPLGGQVLEGQDLGLGASLSKRFSTGTQANIDYGVFRTYSTDGDAQSSSQLDSRLGLQVTQPLLRDAGRQANRRSLVIAQYGAAQSQETLRNTVQNLIYDSCQAYWDLVFRQEDIGVKRQALDLAQEQLERNQAQVELGALAPVEMIQAEQAVASAEYQLIQAEQGLANAQLTLGALMMGEGRGYDEGVIPTSRPAQSIPQFEKEAAIDVALASDPTLESARQALKSRNLDSDYFRNQRRASLDLATSLSLTGFDFASTSSSANRANPLAGDESLSLSYSAALAGMMEADSFNWGVSLILSTPIGNHSRKGAHERAQLAELEAEAAVRLQERNVEVAMTRALRQLQAQERGVEAARRARDLSERQLKAEEEKFAVGSTSNFQVLQFQRQLAEARTQELQSQVNLEMALNQVYRVQGILLDHYGIEIEGADAVERR